MEKEETKLLLSNSHLPSTQVLVLLVQQDPSLQGLVGSMCTLVYWKLLEYFDIFCWNSNFHSDDEMTKIMKETVGIMT